MPTERDMQKRESTRSVINVRGTRGESKSERTMEGQTRLPPFWHVVFFLPVAHIHVVDSRGKIRIPSCYPFT